MPKFINHGGALLRKDKKGFTVADLIQLAKENSLDPSDPISISDAEGNNPSPVYSVMPCTGEGGKNITWLAGE